jgi:hypothetical protein
MVAFFVNLKKQSHEFFEEFGALPKHWLLSSHRVTPSTQAIAEAIVPSGDALMADNGTIEFIRATDALFEEEGDGIRADYSALCKSLPDKRRTPYTTEVPESLRDRAIALFDTVADHVDQLFAAIEPETQTDIQFAMGADHLVAKEDWTIACLLGMGIERELLGFSSGRFVTRNKQSLRGLADVESDARAAGLIVFATLAATDYTVAKAVGREAAQAGARNIALGFAGLNKDNTYTDVTFCPRRRFLENPGPRRYVRLAEIVCGLRDGYREAGCVLERFHALGLGARTMWPILVAGFDRETIISVDATSAIRDAEGPSPVIYEPGVPYSRVPVKEVASHLVEFGALPFHSPVLDHALAALPCDVDAATDYMRENNITDISHDALRTPNPLSGMLPLFANGTGTAEAGRFMAHHNYAVSIDYADRLEQGGKELAVSHLVEMREKTGISITTKNGARAALDVLERMI